MNRKFTIILLAILSIALFKPNKSFSQNTASLSGKWELIYFDDTVTYQGKPVLKSDMRARITFQDSAMTGKFYAYLYCNQVHGTYSLFENNSVKVSPIASTARACIGGPMELDDEFIAALSSNNTYIKAKDTLTIFYGNKGKKLVFAKSL